MMTSQDFLQTRDGVIIACEHRSVSHRKAIIVAPGFFNSKRNRWMQKTAEMMAQEHDVFLFDFRGHGESSGKFTWSAREHLDLEAVLDYVLAQGYKKIGVLAFSLGAAATMNLLFHRHEIISAVLISPPASFWGIEYHFWRAEMFADLQDNIECDWEGKGARTGFILFPKPRPIYNVKRIKDACLFFIHGDRDWIIHDRHSRQLYQAANVDQKRLEIIKGGMHAERLIQQFPERMQELFLEWFTETLGGNE